MKLVLIFLFVFCIPSLAEAKSKAPDCSGGDLWPASMAYTQLKNAAVLGPDVVDFSKTESIKVASEKIGKDLYHQVHDIKFFKKTGEVVEVIAISDASSEECSMSDVRVLRVTEQLK